MEEHEALYEKEMIETPLGSRPGLCWAREVVQSSPMRGSCQGAEWNSSKGTSGWCVGGPCMLASSFTVLCGESAVCIDCIH